MYLESGSRSNMQEPFFFSVRTLNFHYNISGIFLRDMVI
jgi:hypothetical protein